MISLLLAAALAIGAPGVAGEATWYCSDGRDGSPVSDCTRGYGPDDRVAAIDRAQTPYEKGDLVRVSGPAGSVDVTIVDVCACGGDRVIDLPIGAFERVAGDWRAGVVDVRLELVGQASSTSAPAPTLPPTDTQPPVCCASWSWPDPEADWRVLLGVVVGWRVVMLAWYASLRR